MLPAKRLTYLRCFLLLLSIWVLPQSLVISQYTSYYEKLGIQHTATTKEIRKAFKKLVQKMHPDKNPNDPNAEEKFREINEIYEILKDEKTRKIYDRKGEDGIKDMKDEQEGRKPNYHRRSYNDYQMEGLYDDDDEIVTFDSSEFDFVDRGSDIWFVNFYSTWCSHCHDLAPTYRLLAKSFFGTINVGAVNCQEQRYLCNQQGIRSYPSLVLYVRGRRIDHRGHDRSLEGLIKWTFAQINPKINRISTSNYLKAIISGKMSDSYIISVCSSDADCIEETNNKKLAAAFDKFADFYSLDCEGIDIDCEGYLDVDSGLYAARGENVMRIKSNEVMDVASIVGILKPKLLPEIEDPEEGEGVFSLKNWYYPKNHATFPNPPPFTHPDKLKIVLATTGPDGKNQPILLELRKIMSFLDNDSSRFRVVHFDCNKYHSDCSRFINVNYQNAPKLTVIFVKNGQFNMFLSPSSEFRPAEIALATKDVKWTMPDWIQQLDHSNFDKVVYGKNQENEWWFIDFYSPSCPPCKSFMKVMHDFALDTREETMEQGRKVPKVRLASVDCSLGRNNAICNKFSIRSWPSGRLIKTDGSQTFDFDEDHSVEGIRTFFEDSFDPPLIKFTQESFTNLVQKRPQGVAYLVKFGTTWCNPCRQAEYQMKILSRNLRRMGIENLKIGFIDCDEFKSFCTNRHFVESYPTIKVFPVKWSNGASFEAPKFSGWQRNHLSLGNFLADEAGGDHENFPIQYSYNHFQPLVNQNSKKLTNKLLVIDYYANWCQPCLEFKPKFTSLAIAWQKSKYAQFFKEKANNFEVNFIAFDCAGSQRNQMICQQQQVPHYPYVEYRFKHKNHGLQKRKFDRDNFETLNQMIDDVRLYAQSASNVQYDYNYKSGESDEYTRDEL